MAEHQDIEKGITGAKVQSWEKHNARELLARIVKDNPGTDDEGLFHAFSQECAPFFMEICRYWFANNLRALKARPTPIARSVDRVAAQEHFVAKAKDRAVELVLLDYVLPNGKMLRDSTFGECAEVGGWLTKLAHKGQPNDKVGAVMSEKEVRAVWKS
jgi:hypothetical protein